MTTTRGGGLGRRFGWLWAAYAVSTYGTWLGFGAFTVVAVDVLHAGAAEVAWLSASGLAVGALAALPLGPWIEFRHKRPVMIGADVVRFAALASVPASYVAGVLTVGQMVSVAVVLAAGNVASTAAGGAFLRSLVAPVDLLRANARFEATRWSASVVGPTLGGAAIGLLGPVVTVVADAVSYLLSALGLAAVGRGEPPPPSPERRTPADLVEGWRHLLRHPVLRPLFVNSTLVNALILAGEAPLAVLMLGPLGFAPWQYGLAFALPCLAGLLGSRLARPLAARYGDAAVLRVSGRLRVIWPLGLVLVHPGWTGLAVVIVVEFALILCCSVFGPVCATRRLRAVDDAVVARVLTVWSVTGAVCTAVVTAGWGVLADATSPRWALAAAGVLLLATPALLPRAVSRRVPRGSGRRTATPSARPGWSRRTSRTASSRGRAR